MTSLDRKKEEYERIRGQRQILSIMYCKKDAILRTQELQLEAEIDKEEINA